jgi:pilus assembly protein CpaD
MTSTHPARNTRRPRSLVVRVVIAGAMASALAACQTTGETTAGIAPPPVDYRERHPISIQEKTRTVHIFVGNSRGGLTPAQRSDMQIFAREWKREATGGIIIDVPALTSNERAAAETAREIEAVLSAAGVPPAGMRVQSYQPVDRGRLATIRVNYPRMTAEAGPCGQWPDDLGPSYKSAYIENRPYYNLGCASQRNLAAMVDNPADLVQPRGDDRAYTARRTTVLDKYRQGMATTAIETNASSGKISDVGK